MVEHAPAMFEQPGHRDIVDMAQYVLIGKAGFGRVVERVAGEVSSPGFWFGHLYKPPPDQFFHDFVGAAENPRNARGAPHAGDGIFVHIARAAVQLQASVDDFPLQVGVPQFGGSAFFGGQFFFVMAVQRPVEMRPADLQVST